MDEYEPVKLMAIFSSGRSGSTWLGALVNSHPQVAYRFEPLRRLHKHRRIKQAVTTVMSDRFSQNDLPVLYDALLPAHPLVEKPPFFAKEHARQRGRAPLWTVCRAIKPLAGLFESLYSPRSRPPLAFKEVGRYQVLLQLLTRTSLPIVYLVRHPCGVVNSMVRGQQKGAMSSQRLEWLDEALHKHDAQLAERYADDVDKLADFEKVALYWRIDAERVFNQLRQAEHALILLYEQVCDDCLGSITKVFNHFNLTRTPQTHAFLDQLTSSQTAQHGRRGETVINRYFSVYRDPKAMRDRWKNQLDTQQAKRILQLVEDSPAFAFFAAQGAWD
jgi:hypothetical protein